MQRGHQPLSWSCCTRTTRESVRLFPCDRARNKCNKCFLAICFADLLCNAMELKYSLIHFSPSSVIITVQHSTSIKAIYQLLYLKKCELTLIINLQTLDSFLVKMSTFESGFAFLQMQVSGKLIANG